MSEVVCSICGTELTGRGWCNWCNTDEQNPQHHAHVITYQTDQMYHYYNATMGFHSFVVRLDDAGKQKVEDILETAFSEGGEKS